MFPTLRAVDAGDAFEPHGSCDVDPSNLVGARCGQREVAVRAGRDPAETSRRWAAGRLAPTVRMPYTPRSYTYTTTWEGGREGEAHGNDRRETDP